MARRSRLLFIAFCLLPTLGIWPLYGQGTPTMTVGTPTTDANGVKYYPVTSVYQGSQPQTIRVLQPTSPSAGVPSRILFVLSVDIGIDTPSSTWGDALDQLRQLNVPNTYNMTLVEPSFNYEPWYGDNILDPNYRMESFIIDDLVPFGDSFLPIGSVPERYLLGFSKSGNGVLFLMLRHPGVFNAGAAWDAPAQLSSLNDFSALPQNFGTQANYATYNIPSLVASNAQPFQTQNRLWISGDQAAWTAEMDQLNDQMNTAGVLHTWVTGATRVHEWNSGWLPGAVSGLATLAASATPDNGNIPPALTGGLPAGNLPDGTKQATLTVRTDDNATCRYAPTAGVAYATMTSTFSNTGGTSHSTSVMGLQNGKSYTYYVRCQDGNGSFDSSDYPISFSVETTGIVLTNSGNITPTAGATTGNTATVTITPSGGFTGAVNVSCSATNEFTSPTDPAACSLSSPSVNISGTAAVADTLKIITESDTTLGVYAITVTGTDAATGKITSSTGLIATVNAARSFTLSNSGNVAFTAGASSGNTSTIIVTPAGGFTGAVNFTCVVTSSGSPANPATCTLSSNPVDILGNTAVTDTATVVTTASTTPGTYTVTVNGSDAVTDAITGSTSLTATVNAAAANPSFALSKSGDITVNPGATSGNTSTISVTPSGGFTGAVNLTCSVTTSVTNPSDVPTCSFSASPVTISGTTAGTATLTVNTTGSTAALELPLKRFFAPVGGAALAMVLFFGVPARRRAWRALFSVLAVIAVIGTIGCSGGGGSAGGGGGGGGGGSTGTTAGSYTVTVTGTDAATGKITATAAVNLTVN